MKLNTTAPILILLAVTVILMFKIANDRYQQQMKDNKAAVSMSVGK
jgi:hypothetical protein